MLILFDHGAPQGVARALSGHAVTTAQAMGWDKLANGVLLAAARCVSRTLRHSAK